jgi:hypothetical protein
MAHAPAAMRQLVGSNRHEAAEATLEAERLHRLTLTGALE